MTIPTPLPRSAISKTYTLIMNSCGAISAITFGLMSLIVGFDVIFRNLNLDIIPASVEITEYMLMVATFIAAPWLLYKGGHIRIDVVVNGMPPLIQRILAVVCNCMGFFVCAILAQQSLLVLLDMYQQGSLVFKELVFPEWWLNLPLLLGTTLLSIEFLRRVYLDLHKKG